MKISNLSKEYSHVLVTGGCGFIGSYLVKFLLDKGHIVTVLDNLSTGDVDNIPCDHQNLNFIEGDILDKELVGSLVKNVDLVLHLASYVGMKLVVKSPELSYQISEEGTENVFLSSPDVPVVLFSSSAVYGLTSSLEKCAEADSVSYDDSLAYDAGQRGYACGKWALEKVGQKMLDSGRKIMILRPFNVIGPGQSSSYGMVVPNFIKKALAGEPITVYNDGEQTRSFTCLKTFAKVLYNLMNVEQAWTAPDNIINMGSENTLSVNELALIIKNQTSSESQIEYLAYNSVFPGKIDVQHRIPDVSRLERLIGHVNWPSVPEIIQDMLKSESKAHKAMPISNEA